MDSCLFQECSPDVYQIKVFYMHVILTPACQTKCSLVQETSCPAKISLWSSIPRPYLYRAIFLAYNFRCEDFYWKWLILGILATPHSHVYISKNQFSLMLVHEGPPFKGVNLQLNNQLNIIFCSYPYQTLKIWWFASCWYTLKDYFCNLKLKSLFGKMMEMYKWFGALNRNNTEKKILRN